MLSTDIQQLVPCQMQESSSLAAGQDCPAVLEGAAEHVQSKLAIAQLLQVHHSTAAHQIHASAQIAVLRAAFACVFERERPPHEHVSGLHGPSRGSQACAGEVPTCRLCPAVTM